MERYDITHWADFVRGVAAPEEEQAMREHLADASPRQRRDVELLQRVAAVGTRDSAAAPPASAVRMVKALGSLRRSRSPEARRPWRVLFDSLGEPALAGVRGAPTNDRHLVVESGDVVVDVRFEAAEPSRWGGAVTGQVLRRRDSRPCSEATVMVLSGDTAVGASLTDDSGEFQADGLPEGPLDLWVQVGREQSVDFPLSTA